MTTRSKFASVPRLIVLPTPPDLIGEAARLLRRWQLVADATATPEERRLRLARRTVPMLGKRLARREAR